MRAFEAVWFRPFSCLAKKLVVDQPWRGRLDWIQIIGTQALLHSSLVFLRQCIGRNEGVGIVRQFVGSPSAPTIWQG